MNRSDNCQTLEEKIDSRLQRIANILLINGSFIDNPGLLNGKMGIAIFFYYYSQYTKNKIYEEYAGELIDEIYEEINASTPVDFKNGITGIGWGIEYLVKNKFVQADTDEVLVDIDNTIYKHRINSPILINSGNDLFGYGHYHISRLLGHKIDDGDLNILIKKYHLIFLTDECERILGQKLFTKFKIESLSIDTINSFIWFLLEIQKLEIFPVKVEKIFWSVPEYIEKGFQDSSDKAGQTLLLRLTEKIIKAVSDKTNRNFFEKIIEKKNGETVHSDNPEETDVAYFIKNTWQQLIYSSCLTDGESFSFLSEDTFLIVDDENNWKIRIDSLNKENLGLTGFAGLGLGLLKAQIEGHITKRSEHRAESKMQSVN
jgi:hypothetical protein